ncbi:MAG: 50S ribosomal protein L23 [Fimbriimonadaceae bacterium]|nr:50S ribosomal protein L23 [Fimbriimonadaceae bacterium]QYK55020.1 MAG: 50S ribosomal protein L23 [Fimbriimonadaceae bacterium]
MKDPHEIIVRPHITEKSVNLSYGDEKITDDNLLQRQYTFIVAPSANKIEIKRALESIYNAGKRAKDDLIQVEKVRTITVRGKMRRVGSRAKGKKADFKKAIVTLGKGQRLEDYGV